MTLYETLGVSRGASPDELKQAWRRLARLHHPDRNPGDPGAAERLAAINAAYTVLSDPTKRRAYDRYGEDAASAFFDPSLAGAPRRSPPKARKVERGEDLSIEVALEPSMARSGGGISVTVREPETCTVCAGTGWRRAGRACARCQRGVVPGIGPYRIGVPAGLLSGQVLMARGYGAPGRGKGAERGDLYITVRVPPTFEMEGDVMNTELPCPTALLRQGGTIGAPLPNGQAVKLRIRPDTKEGQRLRLRGKGTAGRDLMVTLVRLPEEPIEVVVATVSLG